MAVGTKLPPTTEEKAEARLEEEAVKAATDLVARAPTPEPVSWRVPVTVALTTAASGLMVGGIFIGTAGRVYAVISGIAGVGLGLLAARIRRTLVANIAILLGALAIGLVVAAASGLGALTDLRTLLSEALTSRSILRPPVELNPGWQAIIGWLMAAVGVVAAWTGIALDRPALGLLVPLPVAALAGISVPESFQVPGGIVLLVALAIGLGLLSGIQTRDEHEQRRSFGYEARRALRAFPLIAVIVVALVGLSRADFLFPHPLIDPALEAQKPKTVPLSEVEDRVLFEVTSSISGPWRIGVLDVYDGADWRLPPFAESDLATVEESGIVDPELDPGVRATFRVQGLGGTVLPGLPNTVGLVAEGDFAYDARAGTIRVVQGTVQAGLEYTVAAAALPSVDELREVTGTVSGDLLRYAEIPDAPPAVTALLAGAPKTSLWDRFDFIRNRFLDTVTAVGAGVPVSVTPERVDDMLSGSKEGSPFEIVAAQAMLARWVGLPARIGYGYDGGELVDGTLQVRPRHGASFVEVYFPEFKWLPVIGTPRKAKATVGDQGQQQFDPSVLPSGDIAVQVFLPAYVPPPPALLSRIRTGVLIGLPAALLLALAWILLPAVRKTILRSRRRTAAARAGPRERIELAYTEWRDALTDFGYRYHADTPLMLLDRFAPDEEHAQLAWLVTRAIWGDLQDEITDRHAAAAEELSRALRRRLAQGHPATVRAIAFVSRLSRRYPYNPSIDLLPRKEAARVA